MSTRPLTYVHIQGYDPPTHIAFRVDEGDAHDVRDAISRLLPLAKVRLGGTREWLDRTWWRGGQPTMEVGADYVVADQRGWRLADIGDSPGHLA